MSVKLSREKAIEIGDQIRMLVCMIRVMDADELQAYAESARSFDTIMPILDPTRWMHEHEHIEVAAKAAEAVLAFRRRIAEMDGQR